MNKILILSDSHGLRDEITQIRNQHHVDHVIHCGDSSIDDTDPVLQDMIVVNGNCDFFGSFPNDEHLKLNGLDFLITHGHLYGVKSGLLNLTYRAEELQAQVVCYGHTHIAGAEKIGKQLFINPGSIRLPKGRSEKTYAILAWDSIDEVTVNFYTTSGQVIEEMTYTTSLAS